MPHVGRIPSTLEKYRHALSAYLEDITQLNFKCSSSYSFLYFDEKKNKDEAYQSSIKRRTQREANGKSKSPNSNSPIPDTQTRINSSYIIVKKQLDLLSSYFSLIHDDLHGDLQLLRTNLNLLPSNTLHIAQQNNTNYHNHNNNNNNSSLHINTNDDDDHSSSATTQSTPYSILTSDIEEDDGFNLDNILNTKQTQSIQYIVSILQKFIKYNAILVDYIQNKSKIDSFWVHNNILNHPQTHQLNLDVESIISTMCVKDLIHTKSNSCHNILFHDILGCANTKQFFTRIYFIVSIWYSFFHLLHLSEYHNDDESPQEEKHRNDADAAADPMCDSHSHSVKVKPCNTYLTKLFAMTDFSFLTKSNTSSRSISLENSHSELAHHAAHHHHHSTHTANSNGQRSGAKPHRNVRTRNSNVVQMNTNDTNTNLLSPQSSAESYNWSSSSNIDEEEADNDDDGEEEEELSYSNSVSGSGSSSKNDFLLKYLNAQNNYLQSIWHDGIALLEYSLHLLQQQEFRLSCRVAHRCLELFQKQQVEQERLDHQRQQMDNWDHLNRDLYDEKGDDDDGHGQQHNANMLVHGSVHGGGLFMVDPITNQPAQIPGLWYIEMHLANCYHTWGQSNMALYHINRTLDQLGNYQINPDSLTVRLNTRRKFKLLSSYLVQQTQHQHAHKKKKEHKIGSTLSPRPRGGGGGGNGKEVATKSKRRSFMRKIKINNRRRRKSNVFSKLFDRFNSKSKKKRGNKKVNEEEASRSHSRENSSLSSIDDEKDKDSEEENLQLCLAQDLDIKMAETDDEEDDDDEDEELEASFFHNDDNATDNDDNNVQMITLEALLSMHMTKGRILIEMKLLREALDLYTYIINECEALIKYHSLINPHHFQLEVEYDKYDTYEEEPNDANDMQHIHGDMNVNMNINMNMEEKNNNERPERNGNRRRRRRRSTNAANPHHDHPQNQNQPQPPPNTPYRRLTKNIGLENYYAARGDIFFKFKDLKNALRDFSNAIKYGKCKKEMGIYYNLRGVCFHEMKQYERALKDYDNAVKSMYGNHVAWNNRAALLVDMRQYDDAIENANNAIKLDPSYGNAYKHRGVAYHLKGKFESAITDINRCIKLLPNYRPARLALLAIWKDIFECVRVVNIGEGVPLDLVKIMVDYTVGNGYEIDEYMVNFTYC